MTQQRRTYPDTGRQMRLVETPEDRTVIDPWYVWVEPVTGSQLDATDAEIRAYRGDD
ncbi:hypothetical protein ACIPEP_15490 [Curtobacterium sp. NPDC087082]|uniref:hypothetical protein n=1 Tax=Curtobacterium sp. NPDC087082 TaxID=3363966 RepID=UPI00381E95A5